MFDFGTDEEVLHLFTKQYSEYNYRRLKYRCNDTLIRLTDFVETLTGEQKNRLVLAIMSQSFEEKARNVNTRKQLVTDIVGEQP